MKEVGPGIRKTRERGVARCGDEGSVGTWRKFVETGNK